MVVIAETLRGEELRKAQKGEIVDGDDRAPRAAARRDEIRRVEQPQATGQQLEGERAPFQRMMSRGKALCHARASGKRQPSGIFVGVQNEILVLAVQCRQTPG